jgi:hypothetical protein
MKMVPGKIANPDSTKPATPEKTLPALRLWPHQSLSLEGGAYVTAGS